MRPPDASGLPAALANTSPARPMLPGAGIVTFVEKTLTIADLEARKLRHDPTELLTRAVQPALWLLVFGRVFSQARAIPTGSVPYLDFLAPGILAQSVLFIAIFNGISVVWERDLGIVQKLLVIPTPRSALVLGKALAASVRGLAQAVIVYGLAWALGVGLRWQPWAMAGVALFVLLAAACFSTLSLVIACLVKTRERFKGIGQLLTMPLFFASNAIYPLAMMPGWLQAIARVNPLTYAVDGIRTVMLASATSIYGVGVDIAILFAVTLLLVTIGGRLYPRLAT